MNTLQMKWIVGNLVAAMLVLGGLVGAAGTAHAANGTWNPTASPANGSSPTFGHLWSDSTQWSGGIIPGTTNTTTNTDTLNFLIGGHYTIELNANHNVKFINSNPGGHGHAIATQNNSVLSLTSGGAITNTGNGDDKYFAPIRLEGGSGGSYSFISHGNNGMQIYSSVVGTATTGGDYTLLLGGSGPGARVATSGSYVGSLGDGAGFGTLSVIKTGTGVWTINNNTSYSGTTTVRNGRLKFFQANSLGIGTSAIELGDSGTGASDTVDLELANNITFSRNINVNNFNPSGTSIISVRNNLGSPVFSGQITLNRNLTIHTENVGYPTFTGQITGTGGIIKTGAERATFSAANTYSGDTLLTAGLLRLNHVNALQNSTLNLTGSGSISFLLGGNNTYNLGGLKGPNNLAIGGNTISVGANGQSTSYSGVLSGTAGGGGLTKVGLGTLTLSGASANTYSGVTAVAAGTLRVNQNHTGAGNYTVANDARLGGTGAITLAAAKTVNFANGAILAPGASAGTLTVTGGTTFFNGTTTDPFTYEFELGNVVHDLYAGAALNFSGISAGEAQLVVSSLVPWQTYTWDYSDQIPVFTYTIGQLTGFNPVNWTIVDGGGMKVGGGYLFDNGSGTIFLSGVSNVPEPSTLFLLAGGGLLIARSWRRRGAGEKLKAES